MTMNVTKDESMGVGEEWLKEWTKNYNYARQTAEAKELLAQIGELVDELKPIEFLGRLGSIRYVPERTCHIQLVADGKVHLSCGHAVKESAFTLYLEGLRFCPDCGARVVSE